MDFPWKLKGRRAGKSLHTYANQLHEIIAGEAGCGRGFTSYGTAITHDRRVNYIV